MALKYLVVWLSIQRIFLFILFYFIFKETAISIIVLKSTRLITWKLRFKEKIYNNYLYLVKLHKNSRVGTMTRLAILGSNMISLLLLNCRQMIVNSIRNNKCTRIWNLIYQSIHLIERKIIEITILCWTYIIHAITYIITKIFSNVLANVPHRQRFPFVRKTTDESYGATFFQPTHCYIAPTLSITYTI